MIKRKHLIPVLLLSGFLSFPAITPAEVDPLIMGIFPRRNATATIKAFTPFAKYLSAKLGRQVKIETASSFKNFWKGVSTLRYDIVHYNQYHYVRSHKRLGYNVIAMNEELGRSTIAGSIATKHGTGIDSIKDLMGKKIVFGGGPKAMMSYIVPTYLLRKAGLQKTDYREDFSKNPPNAVLAIYYGQAAAAGIGDIVLELPGVKAKCDTEKLKQLAVSKQLSQLPWAVKQQMSEKLQTQLQSILTSMKSNKDGRAVLKKARLTNLLKAEDNDYNEHRKIIQFVLGEGY